MWFLPTSVLYTMTAGSSRCKGDMGDMSKVSFMGSY